MSAEVVKQSQSEMRGKIQALEEAIKADPHSMTQANFDTRHHFVPGVYVRELVIPKDVLLTGKIHKTEHLCILSQGKVSVWTDEGMKTLEAPAIVHSMPGIKRVLYAHEDSTWINVHHNPTDEKDLEKIDEIYVVDSYEQFLSFTELKQIEWK